MDKIKHYKIVETLGSGGMGIVYKAYDPTLERHVAIKVMHAHLVNDNQNVLRLIQEAKAAARLSHPNVVTIYEVGEADLGPYIVMEYINGMSLTEYQFKHGILELDKAIVYTIQILSALDLAHKESILHRDIKSENIILTTNNSVKVLDFGIAKFQARKGLTNAGEILGTVEYIAPEQMLGEDIDRRCDIYSAGTVLYQLLCNRLPFSGESPVDILFKKLNEEPVPPSHYNNKINRQLDEVILKAIRQPKDERWDSAADFIEALEFFLHLEKKETKDFPAFTDDFDLNKEIKEEFEESSLNHSVFIGRQQEFKQLLSIFNNVKIGNGHTAVLMGETGVGKTRLANHFKKYVEYQKTWVIYGVCLYQEGMDAYLPYIDGIREFFYRDNPSLSETERNELKEMIREKIPVLTEFTERFTTTMFPGSNQNRNDASDTNLNLFEGIYNLLFLMSQKRPVILIVDDLQWADAASLRLFHYLSGKITRNPILLFGITRTDRHDLQEDGKPKSIVETLSNMRRAQNYTEIKIEQFNREICDILIDRSLRNTKFSDEFYERVYQDTKGNPFFVLETLKFFKEKEIISLKDGTWSAAKIDFQISVPSRIEDIFLRRLSDLDRDEYETLQVASVIGYKFDPSILANLLDMPKIKLLKMLQRIENELEIIHNAEKNVQFSHPMLADMLYNEIPPALCKEYHLMVAAEIEKIHHDNLGALVGDVAQHLYKGDDYSGAVPLLYKSGMRAFGISAYREASLFLENLLDAAEKNNIELTGDIKADNIYLKLGICYEEIGHWEKSLDIYSKLLEMSKKSNDYLAQINVLMRTGRIHDKSGNWIEAIKDYKTSLNIAKENEINDVLSRIYNNIGIFYLHRGDLERALNYFKSTIQSVNSEESEYDKAHAFTNMGIIANMLHNDHKDVMEYFEKALAIYENKGSKKNQARVYQNIGMIYSDSGAWDKSIQAFENCLSLTTDIEDIQLRALTYLNMGKAYARQRILDKAKTITEKAIKIFRRMDDTLSIAEAYHIFGMIYAAKGNFPLGENYFKKSIALNKEKDFQDGLAENYEALGYFYRDFKHNKEAVEYFKKSAETFKILDVAFKANELAKLADAISESE